jgi:hypothetical protein
VHELERAVVRAFAHRPSGWSVQDGQGGGFWWPAFDVPARRRPVLGGCAIALYQCCTCQYCCRDPWPGPWSGEPHGTCDCS